MQGSLKLEFFGRAADRHELNLYDAGRAIEGLGRTLSILGHFYQTGEIIHQAPGARIELAIRPPAEGSFRVEVVVGAGGGFNAAISAVPIQTYLAVVMGLWVPGRGAADKARAETVRRRVAGMDANTDGIEEALRNRDHATKLEGQLHGLNRVLATHRMEHEVMRAITAGAFADIWRPLGRSANHAVLYGDAPGAYAGTLDAAAAVQVRADQADRGTAEVRCVVKAFNPTSKVGVGLSADLDQGFRFHLAKAAGKADDLAWSQQARGDVLLRGRLSRFYDKAIRKLEVTAVARA